MRVQAIITWFVILGVAHILVQVQLWAVMRRLHELTYETNMLKVLFRATNPVRPVSVDEWEEARAWFKSQGVEFEPISRYNPNVTTRKDVP